LFLPLALNSSPHGLKDQYGLSRNAARVKFDMAGVTRLTGKRKKATALQERKVYAYEMMIFELNKLLY
jgi:hypothetical protein